MPSQKESRIEDFAYSYLQSYYTGKYSSKNVYVFKNETTKSGTIVDGLLTFLGPENRIFTISLNTGCSTQIATLLSNYKKNGLSKLRFATAAVLAIAAFSVLLPFSLYAALATAFITAIIAFIIHSVLEEKYKRKKIRSLTNSLKAVPADEKWIGLSISSLNFRKNKLADEFIQLCKEKGIGLLTVGQRAKVVLKVEPELAKNTEGDFLSHYNSENSIRTAVVTNTVLKVA